ncbi:MAG TPA: creatininase family protein [Bacteroidota bacterium]|nr:creatininase family protein [Bacteroidota bacterium]
MTEPAPGRCAILSGTAYRDIRGAHFEVAVLPWAATEAHNLHLPFGTDIIETEAIAAAAARAAAAAGASIVVLPVIPFGVNTQQMDIPLTINMNPSTQMAVLADVAASVEAHGVPKLVVLNGHGGNDFRQMIRELQCRHRTFLCAANWYRAAPREKFFSAPGDHADEMETSLMMHVAPGSILPLSEAGAGSVRNHRIRAFREGWAWAPRRWTSVSSDTGAGDPRGATAEKGKAWFDAVTHAVADFLVELSAADPNDMYA